MKPISIYLVIRLFQRLIVCFRVFPVSTSCLWFYSLQCEQSWEKGILLECVGVVFSHTDSLYSLQCEQSWGKGILLECVGVVLSHTDSLYSLQIPCSVSKVVRRECFWSVYRCRITTHKNTNALFSISHCLFLCLLSVSLFHHFLIPYRDISSFLSFQRKKFVGKITVQNHHGTYIRW